MRPVGAGVVARVVLVVQVCAGIAWCCPARSARRAVGRCASRVGVCGAVCMGAVRGRCVMGVAACVALGVGCVSGVRGPSRAPCVGVGGGCRVARERVAGLWRGLLAGAGVPTAIPP